MKGLIDDLSTPVKKSGGRRPGAGRPRKENKGKSLTIFCKYEFISTFTDAEIRRIALEAIEQHYKATIEATDL